MFQNTKFIKIEGRVHLKKSGKKCPTRGKWRRVFMIQLWSKHERSKWNQNWVMFYCLVYNLSILSTGSHKPAELHLVAAPLMSGPLLWCCNGHGSSSPPRPHYSDTRSWSSNRDAAANRQHQADPELVLYFHNNMMQEQLRPATTKLQNNSHFFFNLSLL